MYLVIHVIEEYFSSFLHKKVIVTLTLEVLYIQSKFVWRNK